jgi:hypothetical protein
VSACASQSAVPKISRPCCIAALVCLHWQPCTGKPKTGMSVPFVHARMRACLPPSHLILSPPISCLCAFPFPSFFLPCRFSPEDMEGMGIPPEFADRMGEFMEAMDRGKLS